MLKNVFGFSFYALNLSQFSKRLIKKFKKAEAILFSRNDLNDDMWALAWNNIAYVAKVLGGNNVSFHFPMDDCDYVNDEFVKQRLVEALIFANKLGINVVVVHPNLRFEINEWKNINRTNLKNKLFKAIKEIKRLANVNVNLCLENMPPIGNKYDDVDSAILFPEDIDKDILYTWDICHYFNVVKTLDVANNDNRWDNFLSKPKNEINYETFFDYKNNIKHYHFSAFKDIANPFAQKFCQEGVLPTESVVDEMHYIQAMQFIYNDSVKNNKTIIFEISESNYIERKNIFKMLDWVKAILK